jgi:hypothetical protein
MPSEGYTFTRQTSVQGMHVFARKCAAACLPNMTTSNQYDERRTTAISFHVAIKPKCSLLSMYPLYQAGSVHSHSTNMAQAPTLQPENILLEGSFVSRSDISPVDNLPDCLEVVRAQVLVLHSTVIVVWCARCGHLGTSSTENQANKL